MKKTYFSKRIQKATLSAELISAAKDSIVQFNTAKRFAFQTMVREARQNEKFFSKSLHLVLKDKFGMSDYYRNSICREAKALFKSQTELRKLYIKQTDEKIKHIKMKLKKERKFLTQLTIIKQSLIKGKLQLPKNLRFSLQPNGIVSMMRRKETRIWFNTYLFEHRYVTPTIKFLKAKIGRITHRLYRLEQKKEKLQSHTNSVVFGSKKLFKHQFTKKEFLTDREFWRHRFLQARNKQMIISGRKDAGSGNFVFHYNVDTNELCFTDVYGRAQTFSNVVFPYGQDIVNEAVSKQRNCKNKKEYGKPITWSVEDYGTYYIIKCIVEVESNLHTNFSTSDGVIGVDCNVDHFAWANVSRDGNYLGSGKLSFSIHKKTSAQMTNLIEEVVIHLVNLAVQHNKPIVVEELDTTLSKTGDRYTNKKANRMKSMFAYEKMISALHNRADKMGVGVITVNPVYTSISGKIKYMRHFGIPIHQAAALTIGRRGLGYKEKVPTALQEEVINKNAHHWSQWNALHKKFNVRTHLFYRLFSSKPLQASELTETEIKLVKNYI
ncbi:IS200/IS605 family accessory protein TnpB-related protein [Bacillus toyonensis]|uniref:IS200/IS605 family accessory protein TnpB-related protein n=1 Tax=Bacillus toyonensis TaxID=155322 RepID=UPI002E1BAE0C|nr:IS200/IS605 family accessory protein TnpB-related protein [Bacillus toyonensis]MED2737127.1 IS200/IS605 family accessory protein TnpB-related protein [Bacillus toyonensis]